MNSIFWLIKENSKKQTNKQKKQIIWKDTVLNCFAWLSYLSFCFLLFFSLWNRKKFSVSPTWCDPTWPQTAFFWSYVWRHCNEMVWGDEKVRQGECEGVKRLVSLWLRTPPRTYLVPQMLACAACEGPSLATPAQATTLLDLHHIAKTRSWGSTTREARKRMVM